jgi:thiol-disulfide isomerase/thioredoxin
MYAHRIAFLVAIMTLSPAASPLGTGEPAPACSARALSDGAALDPTAFRGQVLYLDFWASWCGPCRESFPFMNALDNEFRDKGLRIVAISVDKTAEEARRFLERYPARFDLGLDVAAACPAAYQLPGMPTSFLIDRAGVIRAVHPGFRSSDAPEIRRQVLDALAARPQ